MPAYLMDTNHVSLLMDGAEPILSPIPGTDAQIAAVTRLHGLTVLTADRYFGFVDRLATANWLGVGDGNVDSARASVG